MHATKPVSYPYLVLPHYRHRLHYPGYVYVSEVWGSGMSLPQNVQPWHAGYLQLKRIKAQHTQEFLPPPYLPKEIHIEKPA